MPLVAASTLKRAVVVALIILLSVAMVGYVAVHILASGGLKGAILNLKSAPDQYSADLKARRSAAQQAIRSSLSELATSMGFEVTYPGIEGGGCRQGQNNWKVHEGYAYRCTQWTAAIYGFDGDFRRQVIKLDENIKRIGWQPEPFGLSASDVLGSYYDRYYGPNKPLPGNFPDGYLVSDLPSSSGYIHGRTRLDIQFAERATSNSKAPGSMGLMGTYPALRDALSGHDYALIAFVQHIYFEN